MSGTTAKALRRELSTELGIDPDLPLHLRLGDEFMMLQMLLITLREFGHIIPDRRSKKNHRLETSTLRTIKHFRSLIASLEAAELCDDVVPEVEP